LVRVVVAASVPLSPDEAYYWVWSRALAPGYLDHPPMVAFWIRAGTALMGDSSLGVRLLAPFSAAAGSILLAAAGNRLFPSSKPGVWAAILLNATLLVGAGSVTMTPDTPLLFFWTACLYALARIASGGAPGWWLAVGAAAGLGLDSKYTAALLGLGIALWLLTPHMRRALRTPWPWAGGAVALLLTAPVIQWNAAHGWVSVIKQGGRAADWHPALRYLGELVVGQFGLATPVIAILMALGAARAARLWRDPAAGLLAALILPGAVVFVQHAIGDRVQANWVAILYPAAALAAAAYAPRWRGWAAGLGFVLTAVVYLQAALAPLSLPRSLDPTLRLAGFDDLAYAAATAARADHATALASEEYGLASLLAWYAPIEVAGNEARWRSFNLPAAPDTPMLLVLSARRTNGPNPDLWQSAIPAGSIDRGRGRVVAETYRLFRVVPRHGSNAAMLPSRQE
jgi:4-amino-4-deoxy-L-arabinose transferase-like glycosyltransferase